MRAYVFPLLALLLATTPSRLVAQATASGGSTPAHVLKGAAHAHGASPSRDTLSGPAVFEMIKALEGEWRAQMSNGVMTNVFRPFAFGSAVMHEEWLNGKPLTATVFYLVGSVLHADHFCDLKNQLRYVGARSATDSNEVTFVVREAHNLSAFPRHFGSTTWKVRDANHLTQDWRIVENGKELRVVRMEFTRTR